MSNNGYSSNFGPWIEKFIAYRVASGFKANSYRHLRNFDKWSAANCPDADRLSMEIVLEYCERRNTESVNSHSRRINAFRLFNRFMADTGRSTTTVPNDIGERSERHVPYILDTEEFLAFFDAADHLEADPACPNREIVLPVMLRLAYCCGLRPQEVRSILLADVSFRNATLMLRNSKNNKDRKIVMSRDICLLLARYVAAMSCRQPYATYLFESPHGGPYKQRWLAKGVWQCSQIANLKPHGNTFMRPYDLRHNFATSVIRKWHEDGRDIDNSLVVLSEYMGHKHLDDTLYYITFLPEMFSDWPQFDWVTEEFDYVSEEDFWNE